MTLQDIQNQVAMEAGWDNWNDSKKIMKDTYWPEVCKRYAREACRLTLEKGRLYLLPREVATRANDLYLADLSGTNRDHLSSYFRHAYYVFQGAIQGQIG